MQQIAMMRRVFSWMSPAVRSIYCFDLRTVMTAYAPPVLSLLYTEFRHLRLPADEDLAGKGTRRGFGERRRQRRSSGYPVCDRALGQIRSVGSLPTAWSMGPTRIDPGARERV